MLMNTIQNKSSLGGNGVFSDRSAKKMSKPSMKPDSYCLQARSWAIRVPEGRKPLMHDLWAPDLGL
eukprot:5844454-Amphidinium_carterae.1